VCTGACALVVGRDAILHMYFDHVLENNYSKCLDDYGT
jgi:hypothetical protein